MVCNSRVILNFAYHKSPLKKEIERFHLLSLISLSLSLSLSDTHTHTHTQRHTQIDVKKGKKTHKFLLIYHEH